MVFYIVEPSRAQSLHVVQTWCSHSSIHRSEPHGYQNTILKHNFMDYFEQSRTKEQNVKSVQIYTYLIIVLQQTLYDTSQSTKLHQSINFSHRKTKLHIFCFTSTKHCIVPLRLKYFIGHNSKILNYLNPCLKLTNILNMMNSCVTLISRSAALYVQMLSVVCLSVVTKSPKL